MAVERPCVTTKGGLEAIKRVGGMYYFIRDRVMEL
jgi:hypothetical protein